MLAGLALAVIGIGLAWSGACVPGDTWEATQVCSFQNQGNAEVRVLACYFGSDEWVPVFHGTTHYLAPGKRMQAANADPDSAWLAAGFESGADLYRPEVVAGASFLVERRPGSPSGPALPVVDVAFVPGTHTRLRVTGAGELVVLDGELLSGLGLRPDTRWRAPRSAAERPTLVAPDERPPWPAD